MYKLGLGVKDESVFSVLRYIVNNYDCTIADLVGNCEISRGTVSKILQFFLDKGLIYKHLIREKTENGVHPYRFRIDPKYNVMVFTLHGNIMKLSLLDLAGKLKERNEIKLDMPFQKKQIVEYIDGVNDRLSLTSLHYRIGYSISVTPGLYGEDDLDNFVVSEFIKDKIAEDEKNYMLPERIIDKPSFDHARLFFTSDKKYSSDVILYIRFNVNEFYHMVFNAYESLSDPILVDYSDCKFPKDPVEIVVDVIEKAIEEHGITRVFVDSDDYKHADSIPLIISDLTNEAHPTVTEMLDRIEAPESSKSTAAEIGSLFAIRDMFTDDIIKKLSD